MLKKSFQTVTRQQCKASIMLEGLAGRGKSGTALLIARALASDWDKVYCIDTENNSLNLFTDIPASTGDTFKDFKTVNLDPEDGYKPSNYLELRDMAINAGAEVVIEDSISHAWQYEGGILTLVSNFAARNPKGDKYAAWRDETIAKEKNLLLSLLRSNKCHVITTVRVKEKFVPEVGDDGKTRIRSIGEQQIMQDDIKFEPDLVLHLEKPGSNKSGVIKHPVATVVKSRYAIFEEGQTYELTPTLLQQLKEYLAEGTNPEELLEKQRQEYVNALNEYLTQNTSKRAVWKVLKAEMGFRDTKLEDIPLNALKLLYSSLIN